MGTTHNSQITFKPIPLININQNKPGQRISLRCCYYRQLYIYIIPAGNEKTLPKNDVSWIYVTTHTCVFYILPRRNSSITIKYHDRLLCHLSVYPLLRANVDLNINLFDCTRGTCVGRWVWLEVLQVLTPVATRELLNTRQFPQTQMTVKKVDYWFLSNCLAMVSAELEEVLLS